AVNFASQPCDERDDDQLEDWLEALPEQRLSYMMNDIIIAENKDIIDKLLEDGKYLIEGEETVYAIGVTKELALEAFMSQYPITYDTWC
ncbi:hypothetical protein, partial [Hydrotalea sp. AMD]|uniref:hypothetical protein n=1 Tax=Hydrotalea sp. AMD TaxID=2501297 RepID=UPI00257C6F16